MVNTTLPNRRLLLMTLGLTYIAIGMLGALPGASLIRLASNTHVSLEVAGSMFTISAFGSMLGIVLSGFLMRSIQPKYLLMLGLFFLGSGSTTIALTSSFPVLLIGQMLIGLGFGFIDLSLNTMATLVFQETLSSDLHSSRAVRPGVAARTPGPYLWSARVQESGAFLLRRRGRCRHHHPVAPGAAATRTGTSSNERTAKASSEQRTAERAQTGVPLVDGLTAEHLCSR